MEWETIDFKNDYIEDSFIKITKINDSPSTISYQNNQSELVEEWKITIYLNILSVSNHQFQSHLSLNLAIGNSLYFFL